MILYIYMIYIVIINAFRISFNKCPLQKESSLEFEVFLGQYFVADIYAQSTI